MVDNTERLVIDLEARVNKFEQAFKKANGIANDNWRGIEARGQAAAKRIDASFAHLSRPKAIKLDVHGGDVSAIQKALDGLHMPHGLSFEHLKASAGGLAAGLGLAEVAKLGDEWTNAGNKIAAAHTEAAQVPVVLAQVSEMAERSRVSLESAAQVYSGMARAGHAFGASQAEVAIAAETVSKALATSGATRQEQQGAISDLVQGMQAGVLQGQELKALLGEVPAVAEAIAKEFGVSVGKVKELGSSGELTAQRVFKAIVAAAPEVDKTFAKTSATIEQAFGNLETAAARFIGTNATLHTGTSLASSALQGLANNFDHVATGAGALGLVIASRLISSGLTPLAAAFATSARTALTTAAAHVEFAAITGTLTSRLVIGTAAARAFGAALALVGGPVGAVLLGATAAMAVYAARAQEAEQRSKVYADALSKVREQASAATPAVAGLGSAVERTGAAMNAVEINRLGQQLRQAQADAVDAQAKLHEFADFVQRLDQATVADGPLKGSFEEIEKAIGGDTAAALEAQRALAAFANDQPSFQGIVDGFMPLLERLAGVRASIAQTQAAIANLLGASAGPKKPDTSWAGTLDVRGERDAFGAATLKDRLDKANNSDAYRARTKQAEILKDAGGTVTPGAAYRTGLAEIAIEDAPSGKGHAAKPKKTEGEKDAEAQARKVKDEIEALQRESREQDAVAATTKGLTEGTLAYNRAKETAIELAKNNISAASKEGQQITSLVAKIEAAKDAEEKMKAQREALANAAGSLRDNFADALDQIILKGGSAQKVFAGLAQTLEGEAFKALLTGGGPMGGLFGGIGGGSGGLLGSLFGGLGKAMHFATGGQISGPGTGTSDSIPVMASHGEFIVNAASTKRNLSLLHAINSGKVPHFATGGLVAPSLPSASFGGSGSGGDVHVHSAVTLNANGGTPEQNADLAKQASAQAEAAVRRIVSDEMRRAMRPGNAFNL